MTERIRLSLACALALSSSPTAAGAQEGASVHLPLSVYESLGRPTAAAGRWALGACSVDAIVDEAGAAVTLSIAIRTLDEGTTFVPLLPAGTAITSARAGAAPVHLSPREGGLSFVADGPGRHAIEVTFDAPVARGERGGSLALPLPAGVTAAVSVELPEPDLTAALVPSSRSTVTTDDGVTLVEGTVTGARGVLVTWHAGGAAAGATLSRARYRGVLEGEVVSWTVDLGAELSGVGTALVPVLPGEVALRALTIDGEEAPIAVDDGWLAVTLRGAGRHAVQLAFDTPVVREDGLPGVRLGVPRVPVSSFELTLPGDKEVLVEPATGVRREVARGRTIARFHVPLTAQVALSWPEAVPLELAEEVEARANASLYHVAHVDEGVLHGQAIVEVEVTRGEIGQVRLAVPPDVQINDVTADSGAVSDWRQTGERHQTLTVFFDRAMSGAVTFTVLHERVLTDPADEIDVPLLRAEGVHRQRGMLALLSTRELTLTPRAETDVTRVGENELPADVRDRIDMTVAHTFRWFEAAPRVTAVAEARARQQGRFDARVDTLASLGDVTTRGATTVEIDVKRGSLVELALTVPAGVSVLEVTAPSLREHHVREDGTGQRIALEFTQEMEGTFQVELVYERISEEAGGEWPVPLPHVEGAEVEQGRVALEALTAVQVDPATVDRLTPVDVSELPQRLVLRTSNPLLLAYKYTRATPAPSLSVRVTRHRELSTHDAIIEEASYRTLYTADGFAVTTARYRVRNHGRQFLRVSLPAGSEVWAARVDGADEAPALASGADAEEPEVLLAIIHSVEGFPVELVYSTPVPELGLFGRLRGELPRPDLVVTRSTWEVFLPGGADYGEPSGTMTRVDGAGSTWSADDAPAWLGETGDASPFEGLLITVPHEGVRVTFEQLYAGQRVGPAGFSLPYASSWGSTLATLLSVLGTLLTWLGLLGLALARFPWLLVGPEATETTELSSYRFAGVDVVTAEVTRGALLGLAGAVAGGLLLLALTLGYLAFSPALPLGVSALVLVAAGGLALRRVARRRAARQAEDAPWPTGSTPGPAPDPDPGPGSGPGPGPGPGPG